MSKNLTSLVRTLALAALATAFASCETQTAGSYRAAQTYPAPARYGETAPAPSSFLYTANRSQTATPVSRTEARKPGLLARIFKRDDNKPRSRSRFLFGRSEPLFGRSREKKKAAPQRPVIPPTIVNENLLARSDRSNTRVVIDVDKQRAFLLVNDTVALEAPVSTGRPGKSTPRGSFRMGQRVRSGKVSTIYGVSMPYWMRLGGSVYGVHAGYLPGYPASAGCIRLPSGAAQIIYDNTRGGTRVNIYSSWNEMGG